MGQVQINVRTRACSRTSIARTKQAALTQCNGERVNSMNVIIGLCHILKWEIPPFTRDRDRQTSGH